MTPQQTVELEFPTNGPRFVLAMDTVSRLDLHLGAERYRLEPLVRAHGRLLEPCSPFAESAGAYVYRIHLDSLPEMAWQRFRRLVLTPLAQEGVEIRAAYVEE